MPKKLKTLLRFRSKTQQGFTQDVTTVFPKGEPLFEENTGKFKIGNSVNIYKDLPYVGETPLVPINDIYEIFKSYWNAKYKHDYNVGGVDKSIDINDPLIYGSVTADGWNIDKINDDGTIAYKNLPEGTKKADETKDLGKINGTFFGNKNRVPFCCLPVSAKEVDKYIRSKNYELINDKNEKTTYHYKVGQPINCSTLASLMLLGIPYKASKYSDDYEHYNISELRDKF
jgi:hypothetical protein